MNESNVARTESVPMLLDNHGRMIDYLRLAVTDKCNLRCFYCMPEEGIKFVKKAELLSYEELLRIIRMLAKNGLRKVRITGGEPFLRKDLMYFLRELVAIQGIDKVAVTTNGTLTLPHLDELLDLGVRSFNLSIDSLDPQRFYDITRRDYFEQVWACYKAMRERDIDLRLNAVVMAEQNIEDIIPMVKLGEKHQVAVRFIEEMPFNGTGMHYDKLEWNYRKILAHIQARFPKINKLKDPKNSTSFNYQVEGFVGTFGIIPAFTRSFCGTCNRLRMTPQGMIKTCLYDDGVFNLRDLLRAGATDNELLTAIQQAINHRAKDGFEAEARRKGQASVSESMATIGG